MHAIVLLQYLGQREQITPRNLLGEAGGGAGNQRAAVLCCADSHNHSQDLWHHQSLPNTQLIKFCDGIIAESLLKCIPFGLLRASRVWSQPRRCWSEPVCHEADCHNWIPCGRVLRDKLWLQWLHQAFAVWLYVQPSWFAADNQSGIRGSWEKNHWKIPTWGTSINFPLQGNSLGHWWILSLPLVIQACYWGRELSSPRLSGSMSCPDTSSY